MKKSNIAKDGDLVVCIKPFYEHFKIGDIRMLRYNKIHKAVVVYINEINTQETAVFFFWDSGSKMRNYFRVINTKLSKLLYKYDK